MTTKTRTRKPKSEYEKKLGWLRKNKTPKHVLEVELDYTENDLRKILAISDKKEKEYTYLLLPVRTASI